MPILMDSDENPIEVTDGGAAEIFRLRKENDRLRQLAQDLHTILPGQPGCGDLSREQRTLADYERIIREGE